MRKLWPTLAYMSFFVLLIRFAGLSFAAPTTVGLEGYWNFDETSIGGENSVADSSGNNNHETPFGADAGYNLPQPSTVLPLSITIENERSLLFDGIDDYVSVGNPFTTDDFTIALWVNPDTLNDENYQAIFGWEGEGDTDRAPSMWVGTTNNILHYDSYDTPGGTRYSANLDNFFTGEDHWVHIAWVKNGAAYDIYKDGSPFVSGAPAPESFYAGGADYYIGNADDKYFDGRLDDVRIYSRALTADEIAELAGSFPTSENFNGEKPDRWVLKSSAIWGAAVGGHDVLQLTSTASGQGGLGYYDAAFASTNGIVVEFDYYAGGGSGADGLSFFLVDGEEVNANNIRAGAFGGALGYANNSTGDPGIPYAYLGVGFDEWGNFTTYPGGPGQSPHTVALRSGDTSGDGSGTSGYSYLTHTPVSEPPISGLIDGGWRRSRVSVLPSETDATIRVEMSWDEGESWHTVIDDYVYNEVPLKRKLSKALSS